MKDIKSVLIGFLLASCMFLIIGADSTMWIWDESKQKYLPGDSNDSGTLVWGDESNNELSQIGRYQITNWGVAEGLVMIDTQTGQPYSMRTDILSKKRWKWQPKSEDGWFLEK